MRIAHALRTAITGGAVLVLAAGCGTEVGGQAESTSTTTTPAMDNLLNPCTDIPDEWLVETGVDPASERDTVNPSDASAWRVCGWNSVELPYRVDVMSSSRKLEEIRANPSLVLLRETTIGTRPALVTRNQSDTDTESCYVAFPADQGSFTIAVGWRASQPKTHDRCDLAIKHATDLERHLPN
ncbi:DUF3558 domain-containing protein [Nocardia puris]|uniref:Uncharacterized protein DUF3558 n=1 Tax=Nocardia puris TaxID=208602 RepID=A0A366DQP1_9NOCA|nr:DUF3558 domain-containing protein [Nocardia puris]MBF6364680.1 DUF3558 domain-containing protein [Nocardia puris]MBF6463108.1 DUF3558 domain-containing protein [Nocardia puris]RBO92407.1 uncharacterized protein DUF3558 [Nocardia puris]